MTLRSTNERLDLTAWQAEILRLTAFPSPSTTITQPTWWSDIMGQPPENRTVRPREGAQAEQGSFGEGKLSLEVNPTRIDWLFSGSDVGAPIGSFVNSLDSFRNLMFRWLAVCPLVRRLAFGAIVSVPVNNREAGYRQIAAYLPSIQLDPVNSSDFLYQINRPRESASGIPRLKINRLSKWSVGVFRMIPLTLAPTPPHVEYYPSQESYSCRSEIDINTSQDFQEDLSPELLPKIFEELVNLGQEIIREGDIP